MDPTSQTVTGVLNNDLHDGGFVSDRPLRPTEVVCSNGVRQWQDGSCLHRPDGPAVIFPNGTYCWWLNGVRHREDGPAVHSDDSIAEQWWLHGQRHRIGGPSTTRADGSTFWHHHGRLHRTDGPAVAGRSRRPEWWVNGQQVLDSRKLLEELEPQALTLVLTLWTPDADLADVVSLVTGALLVPIGAGSAH
jgi:hypothetical protein